MTLYINAHRQEQSSAVELLSQGHEALGSMPRDALHPQEF